MTGDQFLFPSQHPAWRSSAMASRVRVSLSCAVLAATFGVFSAPAAVAVGASATLTPLAGRQACLAPAVMKLPCTLIRGSGWLEASAALSPDARHLYAGDGDGMFSFRRAPNGALRQLAGRSGCLVPHARHGCDRLHGPLGGGSSTAVTVSPDGRNVYLMVDGHGWTLAAFRRDPGSGRLTQLPGKDGCLTAIAAAGCRHINSPNPTAYSYDISVSPEGRSLYLSRAGGLLVFARDASTGALRPAPGHACVDYSGRHGCTPARDDAQLAQPVKFNADGTLAYIGPDVFARDPRSGGLTELPGTASCPFVPDIPPACLPELLQSAIAWQRSPDGEFGYALGRDGVATLQTNPATHLLDRPAQAGPCLGTSNLCTPLRGINEPRDIAISPDGRSAYITPGGSDPGALVVLDRDPTTGTLRQLAARDGCLGPRGCIRTPVPYPYSPALLDPQGRNVYVVGWFIAAFRRNAPASAPPPAAVPGLRREPRAAAPHVLE
jgi:DNA-binding beta-propeller fold protein YncE